MRKVYTLYVLYTLALAACTPTPPPPVNALIDCPRPSDEALTAPELLPDLPTPRADAEAAIRAYTAALSYVDSLYAIEVGKRLSIIKHGQDKCRW